MEFGSIFEKTRAVEMKGLKVKEGIIPDFDKDDENTVIKKLTEEQQKEQDVTYDLVDEALDRGVDIVESAKSKGKKLKEFAVVTGRGKCIFAADNAKVTDSKDHYPINNAAQVNNVIKRVSEHKTNPPWFKGTLDNLKEITKRVIQTAYPKMSVNEDKEGGKISLHIFVRDESLSNEEIEVLYNRVQKAVGKKFVEQEGDEFIIWYREYGKLGKEKAKIDKSKIQNALGKDVTFHIDEQGYWKESKVNENEQTQEGDTLNDQFEQLVNLCKDLIADLGRFKSENVETYLKRLDTITGDNEVVKEKKVNEEMDRAVFDRIDGLVNQVALDKFKNSIVELVSDLETTEGGFDTENIIEYLSGHLSANVEAAIDNLGNDDSEAEAHRAETDASELENEEETPDKE